MAMWHRVLDKGVYLGLLISSVCASLLFIWFPPLFLVFLISSFVLFKLLLRNDFHLSKIVRLGILDKQISVWFRISGNELFVKLNGNGIKRFSVDDLKNQIAEVVKLPFIEHYLDDYNDNIYVFSLESSVSKVINEHSIGDLMENVNDNELYIGAGLKWNFRKFPHALIFGTTGSGKSVFLYQVLLRQLLLKENVQINVVDVSREHEYEFRDSDVEFFNDSKGFLRVLREMNELIDDRNSKKIQTQFETGELPEFSDFFIIIDELQNILDDPVQIKDARKYIGRIMRLGRSAQVFVIISSQSLGSSGVGDILTSSARGQAGMKIMFGSVDDILAREVFGSGWGKLQNKAEYGRALCYISNMSGGPRSVKTPIFEEVK